MTIGPSSSRAPAAPPRAGDAAAIQPPIQEATAGLEKSTGKKPAAPGSKDEVTEAKKQPETRSASSAGAAGTAPPPRDSEAMRPRGRGSAKDASDAEIARKLEAQFKKPGGMKPEEIVALAQEVGAKGSEETIQKFQDALRREPVGEQNRLLKEMYKSGGADVAKALGSYFMTEGSAASFLKRLIFGGIPGKISDKDLASILTNLPENEFKSVMKSLEKEEGPAFKPAISRFRELMDNPQMDQATRVAIRDRFPDHVRKYL